MKSFVKNYIGKAKKVQNLDIVQVSINLEKADEFIFEYEGKHYLKFEVAKRLQDDQFGNTHAVYVSKLTETTPPKKVGVPIRKKVAKKKTA